MIETWGNFNEDYQASNLGKIRVLNRKITRIDGKVMNYEGKILKSFFDKKGYEYVKIYRKNTSVHRIIATTFLNNSNNKEEVNHINCVKSDNRVVNLEWCTKAENVNHAQDNSRYIRKFGKDNPQSVRIRQMGKDGTWIRDWDSISDVKRQLGLDIKALVYCLKGRKHYNSVGGFKWQYLDK
jgi:hypothetical protein